MATFGISMIRNAADVVGPIVEHMCGQVDQVIVCDNGSTDGTVEILEALPVHLLHDASPGFHQGRMQTWLASLAAESGAEWVVPFDSDEYWYSPHHATIAEHLAGLPRHAVAMATLYDHVPTSLDDVSDPNPVTRVGWRRRKPTPLPKVAARCLPGLHIADGNHSATYDGPLKPRVIRRQLVIRHYPYRSAEQFVAKALMGAAALEATDLPESTGQHWRDYAKLARGQGEDVLKTVFRDHFYADDPRADPGLIFDPAP